MRQQLGLAPVNAPDAVRLQDIQNVPVTLTGENFGTFGYLAGTMNSSSTALNVATGSKVTAIRISRWVVMRAST